MARPGEKLELPSSVVGLLSGDWRCAARTYRTYADKTFFKVTPKAKWVEEMTGWQRIIMRSQYGEDYYKAEDLPELYRIGAKYGIHTLFLFAWWKEGMDRNYPTYTEPYPGAFAALREKYSQSSRDGRPCDFGVQLPLPLIQPIRIIKSSAMKSKFWILTATKFGRRLYIPDAENSERNMAQNSSRFAVRVRRAGEIRCSAS